MTSENRFNTKYKRVAVVSLSLSISKGRFTFNSAVCQFHPWHFSSSSSFCVSQLDSINLIADTKNAERTRKLATANAFNKKNEKYDRVKITILLFIAVGHIA